MSSTEEYEQKQFHEPSWMESTLKEAKENYKKDLLEQERLFYTADKGSLLDRIWNKKNKADDKNN